MFLRVRRRVSKKEKQLNFIFCFVSFGWRQVEQY